MNRNDIYRKTPAGEEAMVHRAKVGERKQRMVLVLIDGKTSVGEMSEKVGDSALTESAIATLETDGFVVLEKAGDNTPPPEVPLHKPGKLSQFSTFGEKDSLHEAISISPQPAPVPQPQPTPAVQPKPAQPLPQPVPPQPAVQPTAQPAPQHSVSSTQQAEQTAPQKAPVPQPASAVASKPQSVPVSDIAPQPSEPPSAISAISALIPSQITFPPPPPPPPPPEQVVVPTESALPRAESGGQVTASGEFTLPSFYKAPPPPPVHPDAAESTAETTEESAGGARKLSPVWQRRIFVALGGVALVFFILFAFIHLYSFGTERQVVEDWLSQGLGVPVHVGQVSPVLSLNSALELRQVQIGDNPERNQLKVIRLPGLFARMFGLSFSAEDRVEIFGGSLDATLLSTWRGGPAPNGMPQVRFQQLDIYLGKYPLSTFDGEIMFTASGGLQRAYMRSKPLQMEITPLDKAYAVTVLSANGWQPVPDSSLRLLDFSGSMKVYSDHLTLEKGDMHLLGGRYEGDLELSWTGDKVREVSGKGVLTGANITDLLNIAGFAKPTAADGAVVELEGDLSGALRFHTSGDTPELWRQNLEARGEMKVDRSTLRGLDLIRMMRGGITGKIARRSGMTRFSQFGFNLNVDGDGLKLEKLQLRATSLRGGGEIAINPEGELTGRIALLLFDGEGGPGSDLLLGGRYPLLDTELRGVAGVAPVATPTTPPGNRS